MLLQASGLLFERRDLVALCAEKALSLFQASQRFIALGLDFGQFSLELSYEEFEVFLQHFCGGHGGILSKKAATLLRVACVDARRQTGVGRARGFPEPHVERC